MSQPNIYNPHFDERRDTIEGFHAQRARIGRQLQTERLGLSLWLVPPGQVAYPYHFHLAEEEVLVVLEGALALRTPDGWRRVRRGDVVRFPTGAEGAHQLVNDGPADARFLALSTNGRPDVVLYPDEGKIGPTERTPDGQGLTMYFNLDDAVSYDSGVTRPELGNVDPA
ncbi:MAG TPA: cupin domain-containing protein [Baekduia sp.]|nr:cupin domain-containing protein [Baekduia sp.]